MNVSASDDRPGQANFLPDDRGRVVFETTAPLRELANAVACGAQMVLDEYGKAGTESCGANIHSRMASST